MRSSLKLSGRDLVTIGIFNAIALVLYMTAAFILATTILGGFFATGVGFFIAATPYILMAVKVKKRGVFWISGILLALFALSGGHIPHLVMAILGGFLAEWICGSYEHSFRIFIGYAFFALCDYLGTYGHVILWGPNAFIKRAEKWHFTKEQIESALNLFTFNWIFAFGLFTFILAFLGAFVASKLLKKHFEKAGLL